MDLAGILIALATVITSIATLVTALKTHSAVQTGNGKTIGEAVVALNRKVETPDSLPPIGEITADTNKTVGGTATHDG